jgi:hypothetical protein
MQQRGESMIHWQKRVICLAEHYWTSGTQEMGATVNAARGTIMGKR